MVSFRGQGRGRGGTLILSYISRFGTLLEVQNFEFHFFWGGGGGGGVRKTNMFWGMMNFFLVFRRAISMHFGKCVWGC